MKFFYDYAELLIAIECMPWMKFFYDYAELLIVIECMSFLVPHMYASILGLLITG